MNAAETWLYVVPALARKDITIKMADKRIVNSLLIEKPELINALMERSCNLQCIHCLLPEHYSTSKISKESRLDNILKNLAMQLPTKGKSSFLHEGRIVMPWHIRFLKELKSRAPKVAYGLIDNGTYTRALKEFENFQLDWLDISCDGTRKSHNAQRDPLGKSYDQMMDGLLHARDVTISPMLGGRVTSLMTMTSLNYQDIKNVADELFRKNPRHPTLNYIDELHITTMNPKLPINYTIDLRLEHMAVIFESIKELQDSGMPVYFRLYSTQHLGLLAKHIGYKTFQKSLEQAKAYPHGIIGLNLEGVQLYYIPSSIWPSEGIFIDANGAQRAAYAQSYTLEQLNNPTYSKYTVQQLNETSSLEDAHKANVTQWRNHFMNNFLEQETALLRQLEI
jgi:hypothetical protein